MSDQVRIQYQGLAPEKISEAWKTPTKPPAAATSTSPNVSTDEVNLSRLFQMLGSQNKISRLHQLEFQVSHRTYAVPALDVGDSLINDHLLPSK